MIKYIGCYFTLRVGAYSQRVVVIERVGEYGVCWYREMRMKVVDRRGMTKTLMPRESLKDLPLSQGRLRCSSRGDVEMTTGSCTWALTDAMACYVVLEDAVQRAPRARSMTCVRVQ